MITLNILILFIALISIHESSSADILVTLPNGVIRGRQGSTFTSKPYYIFEKIPFAAPPIGDLRFKAPTPPANWDGILNTTTLDVVCYQVPSDYASESEDCLYINVFTPELPSDGKNVSIPVLLYIYGGAFIEGSAPTGAEFFIDQNIVVVTFNYRLGPFGFLSTLDTVIPGNNGLKDQEFAIKWTHDNIHLFGGDPEKVTISGESAGAAAVAHQLLHTQSEGLFRGAIIESSTALCPWSLQRDARRYAFRTAGYINETFNDMDDSEALLKFLLSVSAKELDEASKKLDAWTSSSSRLKYLGRSYAPVIEIEHDGAFITEKMYGNIKSGNFLKVPLIAGVNSEEAIGQAGDSEGFRSRMQVYDDHLDWLVPEDMRVEDVEKGKEIGESIRKLYTGGEKLSDHLLAGVKFISDNRYNRPVRKHSELQSKFTDVYYYIFSYDGLMGHNDVTVEGGKGVTHAEELNYLWHSGNNDDTSQYPPADFITQRRMVTLWANFVKTLNPTPEKTDLLQNVLWPTVNSGAEGEFLYLDIDANLEVKSDPKGETYKVWSQLYSELGYEDFDTY